MSCAAFEEQVARYVGGDLAPGDALALEQHLRACPECAELACNLEADRQWLSTRPPESSEVDYTAMRREIRRQILHRPRRWRWIPAMVAAAIVLLILVEAPGPRKPPAARVVGVPVAGVPEPVQPTPPVRRVRHRRPAVQRPAELTLEDAMLLYQQLQPDTAIPSGSDSPVEMRIVTRDPNVTITVLQESRGDSQ